MTSHASRGSARLSRLLDLDLLHAFIAVVNCASFTEAAKQLSHSQSAVSMKIRRLEDQLGQVLLTRRRGSIEPTEDGRLFLATAQQMLDLNDRVFNAAPTESVTGRINVGATEHYARAYLPRVVAEFGRRYPDVQVEVHTDVSTVMRAKLGTFYDLVISIGAAGTSQGVILDRSPAVWATSKRHEAHLRTPLPLALQVEGTLLREWATSALDSVGTAWRIAYSSSSMAALESSVLAGVAVGVFKRSSVSTRMRVLGVRDGFPRLPWTEEAILVPSAPSKSALLLRDLIIKSVLARIGPSANHRQR